MNFEQVDRLLDPSPMALEMGYERLASGVLHIACRTDLHRCSGEMFEWWFRSRPNTQQYIWWHPVDHISSEWLGGDSSTHVGSMHKIEERLTDIPAEKLLVQFRHPHEFFTPAAYDAARAAGQISAAVCGRAGMSWDAPLSPDGKLLGGRMLHIVRDTEWGAVLRSHFFLGSDLVPLGLSPAQIAEKVGDELGPNLVKHCYDEFTCLSRFLPSLFIAENRATHPVSLPW